jgi:hypothetical protein
MAKFKTGGMVESIKGAVGGLRYTRNASGNVVMAATGRPHPAKPGWNLNHGFWTHANDDWLNQLTPEERLAWERDGKGRRDPNPHTR